MKASSNIVLYGMKITTETLRDIVFFPLWWYTKGLQRVILGLRDAIIGEEKSLGLLVWLKNIYKPMYGQHDWQGILISIVVRIFQIIFRLIAMCIWVAICAVIFLLWLAAPLLVLYQIFYQLS